MPEGSFETPQTPGPVAEPESTNWPKIILAAVLGLGLLVGAAYAGYWYGSESTKLRSQNAKPQPKTQSQETTTPELPVVPGTEGQTSDWRPLRLERLEFRIPPSFWFSEPFGNLSKEIMINYEPPPETNGGFHAAFSVIYAPNNKTEEVIESWVEGDITVEEKKLLISGIPGVMFNIDRGGKYLKEHHALFEFHGDVYWLYGSGKDPSDYFSQILSTFKFLES